MMSLTLDHLHATAYTLKELLTMNTVSIKKPCSYCKALKLLADFSLNSYTRDGYDHRCKECNRSTRRRISEETKAIALRTGLSIRTVRKSHLGRPRLTREQYLALFDAQAGRCAVCNQPEGVGDESGEILALTLYIRSDGTAVDSGLICQSCDGMFKGARHSARILAAGIAFATPPSRNINEANLHQETIDE